jgi:hypothetical protein
MKLTITGNASSSPLARQWIEALRPVILRHPNPESAVVLEITIRDRVHLHVALDRARDTSDLTKWMPTRPFRIASVELTHFPGLKLAQAWMAAAFVGYLMHESFELATCGDTKTKILDPHAQPYETNPYNRCLRDVLPTSLTPDALIDSLRAVMPLEQVSALIASAFDSPTEALTSVA